LPNPVTNGFWRLVVLHARLMLANKTPFIAAVIALMLVLRPIFLDGILSGINFTASLFHYLYFAEA